MASTPAPPPATYTKFAELAGKQVFQSATMRITALPSAGYQSSFKTYGTGPTITRDGGTYTVTLPDGATATFTAADKDSDNTNATREAYIHRLPNGIETFGISTPQVAGVTLSYVRTATTFKLEFSATTPPPIATSVIGVPTQASDMPKTGTAGYSGSLLGSAASFGGSNPSYAYALDSKSDLTFSANFAAGTIDTTVHLYGNRVDSIGQPSGNYVDLGSFSGRGTIASGSPAFSGTFTDTTGAGFDGAFFGPQAQEMGGNLNITTASLSAVATFWGTKR